MSGPILAKRGLIYSWDDSFVSWAAKVREGGGSVSSGRAYHVNDLVNRLKSTGLWSKLDRLWLFAAENTQSALRDIKAASLATANGSPTFTVNSGYTGTHASSTIYIDTGFNPSTAGGNYTQNSAHVSIWNNTNAASASGTGGTTAGCDTTGSTRTNIFPKFNDNKQYYRINDQSAASVGITVSDPRGLILANRSGASAQQGYLNAVDQGVVAVTSSAPSNFNVTFLAANTSGTISFGDSHEHMAASIGGSLTAAEVLVFYGALRAYLIAVAGITY